MTAKKKNFILLAVVVVVLIALVIWIIWGNTALEMNAYTITSSRLPESFDGYRIAHVSDLHNVQLGKDNEKLLSMLRDADPDMIAITGCGPMCLSMAGYYVTGGDERFHPEKIAAFAEDGGYYSNGNGSAWTLISEGGVQLGLDVTEIPLVKKRVMANLEVDNPIICSMRAGDFTTTGHYIVLVGCEDGLIRVNDPNSYENSEKLWSYEQIEGQIRNLWVIRGIG